MISKRMRVCAIAGAALALTGCVVEEELGVVEEGLVGGTETDARPAIGQFFNGAGSSCTATLVGPRVALTAAHCLSPAYTGTTPAPGARFEFEDASGTLRSVSVDRIHSFATARFQFLPGDVFTTDLAILHLGATVPSNQAVPAAMTAELPRNGERATIFGFGCTDRTPQSGGGEKQYVSFDFGTATTALCWGDSGGPVVFGNVHDGGAIWGVNSDFNFVSNDADQWTDIFSLVPYYKPQIEDVVRGWDGDLEIGVDRGGMDYASFASASATACQTSCRQDGACRSFTWVPSGGSGVCWLKSGVPDAQPAPGIISGIASMFEVGVDRGGSDYATFTPAAPRAEVCAAACARDTNCRAYTYVAPSGGAAASCWLKNAVPAPSSCGTCTSGVLDRTVEAGIDRWGSDIAATWTGSARACAAACAANGRCRSYTFTGGSGTNCWLKDEVPAAYADGRFASGVRRGLETNTDRAGSDYRSFVTARHDPYECQSACATESACLAWTYTPPADAGGGRCWLKSAIPPATAAPGLVSGVKGLEFTP